MKVEIKGEKLNFEIGSIWGVVYDFETLTDGRMAFDLSRTAAVHIAMYGVLLRCNPGMVLTMEEFVEELNNITLAKAMTEHFVKRMECLSQGEQVAHAVEDHGKEQPDTVEDHGTERRDTGAKKKEPTGADQSTGTGCMRKLWAVLGLIRYIFSLRWGCKKRATI